MGRADELRKALEVAEQAFGGVVEQYRLALGCCAACGELFELGMLVIVMVDTDGRLCFEHQICPEDATDVRSAYRIPQQNGSLKPSSV